MSASKSFRSAWSTSKDSESRGVAWYISIESFGVFHLARSIISDLSLRIIHEYMIHACSTSINWRPDQIMFRAALLCSRASPVPLSIDVFGDLLSSRFLLGIFSLQTSPYVSFRMSRLTAGRDRAVYLAYVWVLTGLLRFVVIRFKFRA